MGEERKDNLLVMFGGPKKDRLFEGLDQFTWSWCTW